ncbi:HAD-IIA family hydrolase [Tropicimonas marinistellae]|uniref:HAD-IIA family hydrolase n=1 Tax=Tropicimonas marinistellae TaxID=1739787 RepID=UPI001F352E72|nr:HAD hydrolase-like protein [Tropicimonas marinistellae]
MKTLSSDAALDFYEDVRHRLPASTGRGDCHGCANLSQLLDAYDVFLLDAFGVLNIGDEAIPGAADRIAAIQASGKRAMVLTNAASVPSAALVRKYERLGFRFNAEDVVSSRDVLISALRGEVRRRWGVMADAALQDGDLDWLDAVYLEDRPAEYEAVDGFLMLGSAGWTENRQALLEAALQKRSRPVWVGNPDIVAPRHYGFSVEPGFFAHRLADRVAVRPRFFGKPFPGIFEESFARLGDGLDKCRTIMVGDSLHTDILGARNAGIASALVAGYGFLAGKSVPAAVARTGIAPDYVLERP